MLYIIARWGVHIDIKGKTFKVTYLTESCVRILRDF